MGNVIIVCVLLIIIFFAVRSSVKHFKGEGGCCGGGGDSSPIPVKELDGNKLGEVKVHIEGMHCDNCVRTVTKAINSIDGASAVVNLKKQTAVISYDRELSMDRVKAAVKLAGFEVNRNL